MRLRIFAALFGGLATLASAADAPPRFLVFFDTGKTDVSRDGAAILDELVTAYREAGAVTVSLASYSDSYGSAAANQRLSQERADAVKAYLESHGVPAGAISSASYGEQNPIVATADGVMEAQNRRVELVLGPGAAR